MILLEVSTADYLDIVQTSKHLRQFVRANAAAFCNFGILNEFSHEADLIPSSMINGWLVPTHSEIPALERYLLDKKKYTDCARGTRTEEECVGRNLQVKLLQPGPQYLLWLRMGMAISSKGPLDDNGKIKQIYTRNVITFLKTLNCELRVIG
jgi:hypothetical protein